MRTDRQTDRQKDMTKLNVTFPNFAIEPKRGWEEQLRASHVKRMNSGWKTGLSSHKERYCSLYHIFRNGSTVNGCALKLELAIHSHFDFHPRSTCILCGDAQTRFSGVHFSILLCQYLWLQRPFCVRLMQTELTMETRVKINTWNRTEKMGYLKPWISCLW
jgi:hypothetical protein